MSFSLNMQISGCCQMIPLQSLHYGVCVLPVLHSTTRTYQLFVGIVTSFRLTVWIIPQVLPLQLLVLFKPGPHPPTLQPPKAHGNPFPLMVYPQKPSIPSLTPNGSLKMFPTILTSSHHCKHSFTSLFRRFFVLAQCQDLVHFCHWCFPWSISQA